MTARIDIQIAVDDESVPSSVDIAIWINRAMRAAGRREDADVSVRVVNANEMQQLNSEFREQDKPTNVLSFPAGDIEGLPSDADVPLGDIVVCAEIVRSEAKEQGKTDKAHWAHIVVHGTLHLLGFDHENASDAATMEGLEIKILTDNGIANPYTESPGESALET
jgi:probable rRNA maturation factor